MLLKAPFDFTGYDMSIFDAAFFKLLFDYVKSSGGPTLDASPIESAIINNKQFVAVRDRPLMTSSIFSTQFFHIGYKECL